MSSKTSKSNLFPEAFMATIQQEDYFQMKMMSKLGLSGNDAVIFRVLLRNHAYSPSLKRIWIGKSKIAVVPEPFQLSTNQASLCKLTGIAKSTIVRIFKHLVDAKLLVHKETKSGHLRFFVNTMECQVLLSNWEMEDGIYGGTPNYTVGTVVASLKNKARDAREQEASRKAIEALDSKRDLQPTPSIPKVCKSAEEAPKPARRGRRAKLMADLVSDKPLIPEFNHRCEPEGTEEESLKLHIQVVDEIDEARDYPKVASNLMEAFTQTDMLLTEKFHLKGIIHPSVRGLGLLLDDLRGMDYNNKLYTPEAKETLAKNLVDKLGRNSNQVVGIVHRFAVLARKEGIALNPEFCINKAVGIINNTDRESYTHEGFGI